MFATARFQGQFLFMIRTHLKLRSHRLYGINMDNFTVANGSSSTFEWNVMKLMVANYDDKFAILVLNSPILLNFDALLLFWKRARLRITVDGGTNKWLSLVNKYNSSLVSNKSFNVVDSDIVSSVPVNVSEFLPDIISGDLDSVNVDLLEYCRHNGVNVIETANQDKTDFYKALEIVISEDIKINSVITICEFYGRFDQSMANINTLYKAYQNPGMEHMKIFILGGETITWLLKPGTHKILIPEDLWSQKSYCSLIPVGHPCYNVTTTGLKWNLKNSLLEFGTCVSTSNSYDTKDVNRTVTVITDNYLIWSMSIIK